MRLDRSAVTATDIGEIVGRPLPWSRLFGTHVLVTGANGMLGSYSLQVLLALNDRLGAGLTAHALVRDEARARAALGDLLDRADVRLTVQDITTPLTIDGPLDYVIHAASAARPALHGRDPVGTITGILLGTRNLLELGVAKQSRGIVLMSSAEVYGRQPEGTTLIAEDSYGGIDILNPRACYSEGKRAAETLAAVYQSQHGLRACIARFGHVYGPGLALDDGRVQADFAANVVAGTDIVLNSAGSAVRTYTYVADAIAGMFYALLLGDETAYNIADPAGLVSIRQLAEQFVRVRPDRGLRLAFTNEADARSFSPAAGQGLDSERLARLGWRPEVDLATGIDRMVTHLESAG